MPDHNRQTPEEKLEDLIMQYGPVGGKLAAVMDLMSDAEISAGMLRVYCRNSLDPRKPHPDLEELEQSLRTARDLLKEAFREDREGTPGSRAALFKADWE